MLLSVVVEDCVNGAASQRSARNYKIYEPSIDWKLLTNAAHRPLPAWTILKEKQRFSFHILKRDSYDSESTVGAWQDNGGSGNILKYATHTAGTLGVLQSALSGVWLHSTFYIYDFPRSGKETLESCKWVYWGCLKYCLPSLLLQHLSPQVMDAEM